MADKKVIAVTVVHRTLEPGVAADKQKGTPAKRPVVQVIQPGSIFLASTDDRKGYDKSEYDELKAIGAVRDPASGEKVEVSIENAVQTSATSKKTKAAVAKTPEGGEGDSGGQKAVNDMTGDELDAYLEASPHTAPEGWSSLKVAEKKEWLTKADSEAGNDLV